MSEENKRRRTSEEETERKRRLKEKRRKKRRRALMLRGAVLAALIILLIGIILGITMQVRRARTKRAEEQAAQEALIQAEEQKNQERKDTIAEAEKIAQGYDYDGAIELLQSLEDYDQDAEIIAAIANYQAAKSTLSAVSMDEVTHVFFYSLIVDTDRAFVDNDSVSNTIKQNMTTINEFNNILQAMYDNGYVLVDLHDLATETVDEDGNVTFSSGQIYLPEGKKPFVLSIDDLNYYHAYEGYGLASRMIVGEDGKPTCEYIDADGNTLVGAYDVIPLLDAFLEEHPDAHYHGAKGTIAVTGYDGVLGYRTDIAYKTGENLTSDQQAWLDANPDFDYEQECEEAKAVADCIKEDGWVFASHTWGHLMVGDASLESLQTDTEKWMEYVEPLVGEVDTIVFASGQDLGDWHDYSEDNEKYTYLKSMGFNYFCNVDSSQYFLQIRTNYVRQGRRILGGYRLWYDAYGESDRTSDLFDASEVIDPARTDMPSY